MFRKIIYALIMVSISSALYAQPRETKLPISGVILKDVGLMKVIDGFEESKSFSDSLFAARKGYISLTLGQFQGKWSLDTCEVYYLNVNYTDFDSDNAGFPYFYAETSKGRPILIFDQRLSGIISNSYTDESKQNFRTIIEPFLAELRDVPSLNGDGRIVKMRIGGKLQLHGEVYVMRLRDGTYRIHKVLH